MPNNPAVLVVDDYEMMRGIIVSQLNRLGIVDIQTARSGEEAMRLLDIQTFDLILSDWSMSGMSGLDLLVGVRRHAKHGRTPFILVTAEMQRERVLRAISAGVSDFLLKPFKPDELGRKVRAALSGEDRQATRPEPVAEAEAAPVEAGAPQTVLVVDDNSANLTLTASLLQGDYRIRLANSGAKALASCEASPPDLILLDVMMPEMDGFTVCRTLKERPGTAHIPVIFLTAIDDADRTVEGLELGAVDFVSKPIEPAILKARVATALRISRAHEALREQYDLAIENARLKEEVEAMARHDLKNPLAAIIGMASGLLDHPSLAEDQKCQVKAIETAAHNILAMIHLSSDLLKMEQGRFRLKPRPVDVSALLRQVADECRLSFADRAIVVDTVLPNDLSQPVIVEGDALLLYSVLHNLAKNAIEATPPEGKVRLELLVDDSCRIRIQNPGRVPDAMRDRFFEKYATHGKEGGTGLGTYSAKLIVDAHGGTVSMASSAEEGTIVAIELPIRK